MNYYIYGTGSGANELFYELSKYKNVNIIGFLDSYKDNIEFNGKKVFSPSKIELKKDEKILVCGTYCNEIADYLSNIGFKIKENYYVLPSIQKTLRNLNELEVKLSILKKYKKINLVTLKSLLSKKKTSKLFILGSGPSINKLNNYHWEYIGEFDSWGCNHWNMHPFTPTYNTTEFSYIVNIVPNIFKINSLKEINLDFIKDIFRLQEEDLKNIPDKKLNVLKNIEIDAVSKESYLHLMKFIKELNVNLKNTFFSYISSVVTIYELAILMGYEEIIFCGVDLNNSKYFYEDYLQSNKYEVPFNANKDGYHLTSAINSSIYGTHEMINLLSEIYSNKKVQTFVGTKGSLLNEYFSEYEWRVKNER